MDYRDRLVNMCLKYRPEKIHSVDKVLALFRGRENELINSLSRSYGPEPTPHEALALRRSMGYNGPSSHNLQNVSMQSYSSPVSVQQQHNPSPRNRSQAITSPNILSLTSGFGSGSISSAIGQKPQIIGGGGNLGMTQMPASPHSFRSSGNHFGGGIGGGGGNYRDRLLNMYRMYNPAKISNADTLLNMCRGSEEHLIQSLVRKYGPEPGNSFTPMQPTSYFHPNSNMDPRTRLRNFYMKYNRTKLANVDMELSKFRGREQQMFTMLEKVYGPEPTDAEMVFVRRQYEQSTNYPHRLCALFAKHAPDRVKNVDSLLKTYAGHEDALMREMVLKYGPEPDDSEAKDLLTKPSGKGVPRANTTLDNRSRLTYFYMKYKPDLVPQVDAILKDCPGLEGQLFRDLCAKYGPEPEDDEIAHLQLRLIALNKNKQPEQQAPTTSTQTLTVTSLPYRDRVLLLFMKYSPDLLPQADSLLVQYSGNEPQLMRDLIVRFGPEPSDHEIPTLRQRVLIYLMPSQQRTTTVVASPRIETVRPQQQRIIRAVSPPPQQQTVRYVQKSMPPPPPQQPEPPRQPTPPRVFRSAAALCDYRARVMKFYKKYDPNMIPSIDKVMKQYSGKEDELMMSLLAYYGPEPTQEVEEVPSTPGPNPAYRKRVVRMYHKYDPDMLNSVEEVLNYFAGKEDELMERLCARYGPEPTDSAPQQQATPSEPVQQHVDYRTRLVYMFMRYDPSKLSSVDKYLIQFSGQENDMMQIFVHIYGPEPSVEEVANYLFNQKNSKETNLNEFCMKYDPELLSSIDSMFAQYINKIPDPVVVVEQPAAPTPKTPPPPPTPKKQSAPYRQRVVNFFLMYDTQKLGTEDALMSNFCGQEDDLIRLLIIQYGPEPTERDLMRAEETRLQNHRRRATNFYRKYDPNNVHNVDVLMVNFAGKEEDMIRLLIVQFGPEPKDGEEFKPNMDQYLLRVQRMFCFYDPKRVDTARALVAQYKSGDELMQMLIARYGPEPSDLDLIEMKSDAAPSPNAGGIDFPTRLRNYYSVYDPTLLPSVVHVVSYYQGREDQLMAELIAQHGPEPTMAQVNAATSAPSKFSIRQRVINILSKYEPTLLESLDSLLNSYTNKEEVLLKDLIAKFGPEPIGLEAQSLAKRVLPSEFRARLVNIYAMYDPARLGNVEQEVLYYAGHEEEFVASLTKQYGPEPNADQAVSPSDIFNSQFL